MKCSLLSLSSYLDEELDGGKRGELEAHLLGCQRCSSGLGHLKEEVGRISGLAPVHVPDDSARSLMEQLGLLVPGEPLPPRMAPRSASAASDGSLPWLNSEAGKALPWRAAKGPLSNGASIPAPAPTQPSLSLQGKPADPRPVPPEPVAAAPEPVAAATEPVWAPPAAEQRPPAPVLPPMEMPPAREVPAPDARPTAVNSTPVAQPRREPAAAVPAPMPTPAQMPTPAPAPVVPSRPAAPQPSSTARISGSPARHEPPAEIELDTVSGPVAPPRPSPVSRLKERWAVQRALARTSSRLDDAPDIVDDGPRPWAGRDGEDVPMEPALQPVRPRPAAGRHSLPLMARRGQDIRQARATPAQNPVVERIRGMAASAGRNRPLVVFVGSLLALVVIVLTFGRSASPVAPKARVPSAGSQVSAPAIPVIPPAASAPDGTTAVQLNDVKGLGTGATGMQVAAIRFGNHPGSFYRIVFDITAGASAQPGTPKATVGFKDPTTMWVILDGVTPGAAPAKPVDASTVVSVTQVDPAPAGKTIYEFKLAHPVTASSEYLPSPLRLVLDLH